MFKDNITQIEGYLEIPEQASGISGPFEAFLRVPCGQLRISIAELIAALIDVGNTAINKAIGESELLKKLSELVKLFPWNNFLQNTIISMYQEILENPQFSSDFRHSVL